MDGCLDGQMSNWMKESMNEWLNKMNENEAPGEWYWQGKTEVVGEQPVPPPPCTWKILTDWPRIKTEPWLNMLANLVYPTALQ